MPKNYQIEKIELWVYSLLKGGVHPKKRILFWSKPEGGGGYRKVTIALEPKRKELGTAWHHDW